ncbi:MAG: sel1 repeat family protein [Candidatus Protochlamydia sp.]|nr:sel1 repeat family protein [Candidatus Protochlamydia sp.]
MNEIADRQNIEITEWRVVGPEQGLLWRVQTLVQAVAWTIFTGFLGPIFSQSIYNLWREALVGRKVELYEGPQQIPTPRDPLYVQPVPQTPEPIIPKVSQERFSSKEEAQNALKVLFAQPSPEFTVNDLNSFALASQLDLSEASFISRSTLEQIVKTLTLSEVRLPFPATWDDWQKSAGQYLNSLEMLRYVLNSEDLSGIKISFIFDPSIADDLAKKSVPLSDLFATLSTQESLKLMNCLRAFSDDQARHFFVLFLMAAHRNPHCSPPLQVVLSDQPRLFLPLFISHPQFNSALEAYLDSLSHESLSILMAEMETPSLMHLFHHLYLQPDKQKLLFLHLMQLAEKEELIFDLFSHSQDQNAFLAFISSYPDFFHSLFKKMHTDQNLEIDNAQYRLGTMYEKGQFLEKNELLAAQYFQLASNQGHTEAQYRLGAMHKDGRGVVQNDQEAFRCCQLAALQGHAWALYDLANMYKDGRGVVQNSPEAVRCFQKATEKGLLEAQYSLGWIFQNGWGVLQSHNEAANYYRLAANRGHSDAQYRLGAMHKNGQGVPQSDEEAFRYCQLAADQGHSWAQYDLGNMYKDGRGVEQNYKIAFHYFQKASEQNHLEAQFILGWMYEKGQGVLKNDEVAALFYQLAADQGHANAQSILGWMYANGRGVQLNDEQAVYYYTMASKQGHANAQCNLGWMYQNGRGIQQNVEQAVEYFKMASKQGHANAQFHLGLMYQSGRGVQQNDEKAVIYFKMASKQGHANAQTHLGWMYQKGRGVEKNLRKAIKFYVAAADQGNSDAQFHIGDMLENEHFDHAIEYYKLAADQNHAEAQFYLGRIFGELVDINNGSSTRAPRDADQSIKYLKLAAHQGHQEAQFELGLIYQNGKGVPKDKTQAQYYRKLAEDQEH